MAQGSAPPHLIDEISKTDEVIDRARALVSAERRTTSLASTSGVTFQDAFQIVAKREEEKRKKSSKDARKRAQADQLHFPGSRIGVDSEMSAYWMVMEVRLTCARNSFFFLCGSHAEKPICQVVPTSLLS